MSTTLHCFFFFSGQSFKGASQTPRTFRGPLLQRLCNAGTAAVIWNVILRLHYLKNIWFKLPTSRIHRHAEALSARHARVNPSVATRLPQLLSPLPFALLLSSCETSIFSTSGNLAHERYKTSNKSHRSHVFASPTSRKN